MRARAGLLALGSSYSPRLPDPLSASGTRGFRPRSQWRGRGGFYRLPWALVGIPGANNAVNANKITAGSQLGPRTNAVAGWSSSSATSWPF